LACLRARGINLAKRAAGFNDAFTGASRGGGM
jgi:hypothetical protein